MYRYFGILVIFVVPLSITLWTHFKFKSDNNDKITQNFEIEAEKLFELINIKLNEIINNFHTIAINFGIHGSYQNMNIYKFNTIINSIGFNDVNFFAIGYNAVFNYTQRDEFNNYLNTLYSAQYNKTFYLKLLNGTEAPNSDDYYVGLTFITPFSELNIGSSLLHSTSPQIRELYKILLGTSNRTTITEYLQLQSGNFLIFIPSYDRDGTIVAFSGIVFQIEDLLNNLISNNYLMGINIYYIDNPRNRLIYSNNKIANKKYSIIYNVPIFEKNIFIEISRTQEFDNLIDTANEDVILTLGIILSFVILFISMFLLYYQYYTNHKTKTIEQTIIETTHSKIINYICHEIRNPLNTISSLLYMWSSSNDPPANLMLCINSMEQIKSIINDILDMQKLLKGNVSISTEEFNISTYVKILVDNYIVNILNTIHINIWIDEYYIDNTVITDKLRINQIILNGLSNASKFTTTGFINIYIYRVQHLNDKKYINIKIIDTGKGIEDNINIDDLFIPFGSNIILRGKKNYLISNYNSMSGSCPALEEYMKNNKTILINDNGDVSGLVNIYNKVGLNNPDQNYIITNGSGLGLHISRLISRLLGGELILYRNKSYFTTDAKEGITFDFLIEDHRYINGENRFDLSDNVVLDIMDDDYNMDNITTQEICDNFKDINILIVDDEPGNRFTIDLFFKKFDFKNITLLEDGDQITQEHLARNQIILLDIVMKRTNGVDVCKKLRDMGYDGIIIATTGNVMKSDFETYKQVGFNGLLSKPYNLKKLCSWLYHTYATKKWSILF